MAIGVAAAVESLIGADCSGNDVQCKWPNDVLINGRKSAGILLESMLSQRNELDGLIAGCGVNVAHFPTESEYPATKIHEFGAPSITVEDVLQKVCESTSNWYDIWQSEGFGPIRSEWLRRAYGIGQDVIVRLATETLNGVFISLDEQGALIIEINGEQRHISAGDVFFDESSLKRAS